MRPSASPSSMPSASRSCDSGRTWVTRSDSFMRPLRHQVDRFREVLTRGRAGSHNRRFLVIELIKRQRCFAGGVNPEQDDRAARANHRDSMSERLHVAGRFDDDVGAAAVRDAADRLHAGVASGRRDVGAQPFGQRALPCTARDADHERGAARLRKLCVKLSGDAEPHNCDGLTGRDSAAPLGVKTGGEYLNQWRRLTVDRCR